MLCQDLTRIRCVCTIIFQKKFCYAFSTIVPDMQMPVLLICIHNIHQTAVLVSAKKACEHQCSKQRHILNYRQVLRVWGVHYHHFLCFLIYCSHCTPKFTSITQFDLNLTDMIFASGAMTFYSRFFKRSAHCLPAL